MFTKICLLFLLQYVQSKATKMSPYELVTKEVESLVEKLICYLSTFIPPHLPRNYYPHVTCPEILVWARPLLLLVTAMDFPFHGTINFKIYFDFTKKYTIIFFPQTICPLFQWRSDSVFNRRLWNRSFCIFASFGKWSKGLFCIPIFGFLLFLIWRRILKYYLL